MVCSSFHDLSDVVSEAATWRSLDSEESNLEVQVGIRIGACDLSFAGRHVGSHG